jgi:SSS family solute:Na+ symporter
VLVCGFDLANLNRNVLLMMTALLALGTIYTVVGGMLSVLITDFLQFIVMSLGLIAVTILILTRIGFEQLAQTVSQHYAAGGFNPFSNAELGCPYVIFQCFLNLAAVLTWQTTISRLLAAKDAKTGQQIYTRTSFFFVCRWLIPGIWGIAALTVLTPAAFHGLPSTLQENTTHLYAMPLFLSQFVPVGLMGLLLAAMLAADMSCTSSYMITWTSVIYNDILAPFRKTRWSEKRGLLWNRAIVSMIGLFLLVFGLWYPLKGNVWDYLGVTGTIYLASISTLLIACCYWKSANNWGAAGAIILGAVIPLTFLVIQQVPSTAEMAKQIGPYYSGIAAYLSAGVAMVVGSLLKPLLKPEPSQDEAAKISAMAGGEP